METTKEQPTCILCGEPIDVERDPDAHEWFNVGDTFFHRGCD
jgi:hypothetical protein